MLDRTVKTISCTALVLLASLGVSASSYIVKWNGVGSNSFVVTATVSMTGTELQMEQSWPGDVPSVGDKGWPALVRDLRVADSSGHLLSYVSNGPAGWALKAPYNGTLTLTYTVDYSEAATANWPAPREAAFADADNFSFPGKSIFITTSEAKSLKVRFVLDKDWRAIAPWPQSDQNIFRPAAIDDLRDNIIVLTRSSPDIISAGGFRVTVTSMGAWRTVRPGIRKIVAGVIPFYIRMMGPERALYSVVLLPVSDTGGESYRNSFVFNVPKPPSNVDASVWGRTIAHEIFHYWNGWRLKGTDYPSSQWFQEGFTDYAADMAMVGSGSMTEREFLDRIQNNLDRYQKLTTPLDAPGNRKGPPLYGGGALVALCWDIQIRHATSGKRSLADFYRVIWQRSDRGDRSYEWKDIKAALNVVTLLDWEQFHTSYIHGTDRLPHGRILALAGLKIVKNEAGQDKVENDAAATATERSLFRSLIRHQ